MEATMQYIKRYIDKVLNEEIRVCEEQKLLCRFVKKVFETEDLRIDEVKADKYFGLQKYFPFQLLDWEKFCFILHCCTFTAAGIPRFPDLYIYVGRGSGKNGYKSFTNTAMISPAHGVRGYNIQDFAAAEDNAKTSFMEVHGDVLERNSGKMKNFFKWSLESIKCTKTNSLWTFHTSQPKSKDGGRPGMIGIDEIHVFENNKLIKVAEGGLGKVPEPRKLITTTDGDVRDAVGDEYKAKGRRILRGEIPDNGFLPFMCCCSKEEINDPENWVKAVPSLDVFPWLKTEMLKEFEEYKLDPITNAAFATKRMNCPSSDLEAGLTSWENIQECCKGEMPEKLEILYGRSCIACLDFAKSNDFVAAGLIFRVDGIYYYVTHTWVCEQSADLYRIRFPLADAEARGEVTMVKDVEIMADIPIMWMRDKAKEMNVRIVAGACDSFRFAYVKRAVAEILGFEGAARKTANKWGHSLRVWYMNRPSDLMKTASEISTVLERKRLYCGDNKIMRWYMGNVKKVLDKDGNTRYEKIEEKSRKTDGALCWINGMTLFEILEDFDKPAVSVKNRPRVKTY